MKTIILTLALFTFFLTGCINQFKKQEREIYSISSSQIVLKLDWEKTNAIHNFHANNGISASETFYTGEMNFFIDPVTSFERKHFKGPYWVGNQKLNNFNLPSIKLDKSNNYTTPYRGTLFLAATLKTMWLVIPEINKQFSEEVIDEKIVCFHASLISKLGGERYEKILNQLLFEFLLKQASLKTMMNENSFQIASLKLIPLFGEPRSQEEKILRELLLMVDFAIYYCYFCKKEEPENFEKAKSILKDAVRQYYLNLY